MRPLWDGGDKGQLRRSPFSQGLRASDVLDVNGGLSKYRFNNGVNTHHTYIICFDVPRLCVRKAEYWLLFAVAGFCRAQN